MKPKLDTAGAMVVLLLGVLGRPVRGGRLGRDVLRRRLQVALCRSGRRGSFLRLRLGLRLAPAQARKEVQELGHEEAQLVGDGAPRPDRQEGSEGKRIRLKELF